MTLHAQQKDPDGKLVRGNDSSLEFAFAFTICKGSTQVLPYIDMSISRSPSTRQRRVRIQRTNTAKRFEIEGKTISDSLTDRKDT